jgi:hypothetical protein
VAFLGLDAQDQRSGAEGFLKRFPVNYPSVFDQSAQQAASLGGGQGWPTTFFIDRTGSETFVYEGAYASERSSSATSTATRSAPERRSLARSQRTPPFGSYTSITSPQCLHPRMPSVSSAPM